MGAWQFQSNLNRGELDPLLVGRIDLQAYYNGVKTGSNVLSIPQGGMKKRPGQEFLGSALGDGRLENFSFNVEQNYLLIFTDLKMQIYKDGVLQTNINGSGNDFLAIPYTLAQIQEFDYIQSADTVIITHPDVEPKTITRTSDTAWTIAAAPLTNIPQFDFNDASSPTPVDEIQRLTFTNDNDGDRFKISLNGILTEEIVLNLQDSTTTENDIRDELLALPNTGNSGIDVSFISGSPAIYEITFSGDSADDWDEMTGTGIVTKSASFEILSSTVQDGTARKEDTWSSTRGWPVSCTFHEGRLWFGGSKSRPATLWGSRASDFFNFRNRKSLDDESIEATLDTDQVNAIQSIFSNRALQIFTSGGEFYVPNSPITPSNIAVSPQTNLGSKRVRPVTLEGVTLFPQRTGKSLVQFVFLNDLQANQSRSVSFLAPHLIKSPIKLAVSRGTEATDANYIYILNNDGTLTVFNSLVTEDVTGFTRWDSSGFNTKIKSIAVVDNQVYLLVERVLFSGGELFAVNPDDTNMLNPDSSQTQNPVGAGTTVYYLERENTLLNTDSSVIGTGLASDTLTGLDHLNGQTVEVKADGAVQPNAIVSGGQITIGRTADTIEAGLKYRPEIELLPLNVNLQNGPNASKKKKIQRVSLQVYESNGIIVNDQRLADKTIGVNQFDAPEPQTGVKRIYLSGWSLEASVTITQDTPMPFNILNVGMEVAV